MKGLRGEGELCAVGTALEITLSCQEEILGSVMWEL